jgi:hypothetical protein
LGLLPKPHGHTLNLPFLSLFFMVFTTTLPVGFCQGFLFQSSTFYGGLAARPKPSPGSWTLLLDPQIIKKTSRLRIVLSGRILA